MITIVAGGRDFDCKILMTASLDAAPWLITEVVSGGARGADYLGEEWATDRGVDLTVMPADWDKYGKKAGMIRNSEMAKYGEALIAFWDGKSRGTKGMIDTAMNNGLDVWVVRYDPR